MPAGIDCAPVMIVFDKCKEPRLSQVKANAGMQKPAETAPAKNVVLRDRVMSFPPGKAHLFLNGTNLPTHMWEVRVYPAKRPEQGSKGGLLRFAGEARSEAGIGDTGLPARWNGLRCCPAALQLASGMCGASSAISSLPPVTAPSVRRIRRRLKGVLGRDPDHIAGAAARPCVRVFQ